MLIILSLLFVFNATCIGFFVYKLNQKPQLKLNLNLRIKLAVSGVIAFIADTIGLGSFAVNIGLAKCFNTFEDYELPAVNNGAQVIPGILESLFFMQLIPVDMTTLVTLVTGTCVGGVLGASWVSHLNQQAIRFAMLCCFSMMVVLLMLDLITCDPSRYHLTHLEGSNLVFGFFATMLCGALTCAGIGLFAMIQAVLFLLGVSPAVAFPIMTTAGAMQQPLTTLVFLQQDKIPLKKTLLLSLCGCIGVLIALPIVSHLNTQLLHGLLMLIILFNFYFNCFF